MHIKSAEFKGSHPNLQECPRSEQPEYAFIGRSNVGKSSLLNMLVQRKGLAKTSGTPGKTRLINRFFINEEWYLADLPGYGFARVSKSMKREFKGLIADYILKRENLANLFLLIDSRLAPQKNDLAFMRWLGEHQVAFSVVFTKIDKLSSNKLNENIKKYNSTLAEEWEELPPQFITSAETGFGRAEILTYLQNINRDLGLKT